MKKLLYSMPAFIVCMFIGTIALLVGFGTLTLTAWGYVLCSVLGSTFLWKGKWWGGIVGAGMGVLMILDAMLSGAAATRIIGLVFLVYYLVMALVCRKTGN